MKGGRAAVRYGSLRYVVGFNAYNTTIYVRLYICYRLASSRLSNKVSSFSKSLHNMRNVKQTAKAYKPKNKLPGVVAKQNTKFQVVKRVADASKIVAAIAKTTASKVMQPVETLCGEAKRADILALKSLENEVSF